jgi:two-component system cell cycle sensor histidine kinase/response regulator CckA
VPPKQFGVLSAFDEPARRVKIRRMGDREELDRLALENAALRARLAEQESHAARDADAAAFLRSVLSAVPAYIMRTDSRLRVRYINRYQPGLDADQVLGRSMLDFLQPDYHELASSVCERTRKTGEIGRFETLGTGPYGDVAHYETHVAAMRGPDGEIGVCLTALDITAATRGKKELRESQDKLRVALNATGLGIWSWEVTSSQLAWDARTCRMHGRESAPTFEEFVNTVVHAADRREVRATAQRLVSSGRTDSVCYRALLSSGGLRWILVSGSPVATEHGHVMRVMGGALDVTEQRVLAEQLRQAQKMEAIGNLSAGVAHNFNNMLAVILPVLETASQSLPSAHTVPLLEAAHAARRASDMVRQLMTFAGQRPSSQRTQHRTSELVNAALEICHSKVASSIELHAVLEDECTSVLCDAGQIEQVLVNLVLNACDAVLEAGCERGQVTIRVMSRDCNLPASIPGVSGRPSVRVQVCDNGTGMNDTDKAKLFEPFFTTKPVGSGTGMGLATSFAIVREHQGVLTYSSERGQGSVFTLELPTYQPRESGFLPRMPAVLPQGLLALLIAAERNARSTLGQQLAAVGLTVHCATGCDDALRMLARDALVDVVLFDQSSANEGMADFKLRVRQLAPRARFLLLTSGASEPELAQSFDAVVATPCTPLQLTAALARALVPTALRHVAGA